ncbi:MAG TPA: hypothetical protein VK607_04115, partial [Kofleriaceae bacterium]|nr:hypothetical protein [Kofleriaceae bacterium]
AERPAPPAPDGSGGRKRPVRRTGSGVGSITSPAGRGLPPHTIEVHRGSREVDRPRSGDHTPNGAPMEDVVDIKPTRGGGVHRAPPPTTKDSSSP